jgi:cobalt-precorrin-5B (C1)-methyltransferase
VSQLRRGWTTGACATAAAKAAYAALRTGHFPDPVDIPLPGGRRASFALAETAIGSNEASAAVVKDAGDDPDVTHGALIRVTVRSMSAGLGLRFRAGPGVGTITRAGLPLPPGEPAINPGPRGMISAAIAELGGEGADLEIEISIPGGEELAQRTLNPRLGIVGGLSILGTTGIVIPYSCAAWIDSIHRGIDVARAAGLTHIAGATGRASEAAVQTLYGLPEVALIEMGDFVGGMLKYLRSHPVERVTVAGGVGKMTKLAQGRLDLHSRRGGVDFAALAQLAAASGAAPEAVAAVAQANTAAEALTHAPLAGAVAAAAWTICARVLNGRAIAVDIAVFDPAGRLLATHDGGSRNRLR